MHFSISILLYFYNLHTQMYVVAKFQLHIPRSFKVTTLQDSSNRKINLYSKYQENKLPVVIKTDVTYKWSDVLTQSLHHHVCHELRNGLPGKLILLLLFFATNKVKIHEEISIKNNHLTSHTQAHKHIIIWVIQF